MDNCPNKWIELQKKFKYEISLMKITNSQIENSINTIINNINKFYELKIKTKETYDYNNFYITLKKNVFKHYEIVNSEQTKLDLANYYSIIENFFITLKKDKNSLIFIISHYKKENYEQLINLFCNFYFENPFNPNFNQNDLLRIIYNIIEIQIDKLNNENNIMKFLDDNFIGNLLKSLCRRIDIKNYISMILKDIILDMENMSEQFINFEIQRIREFIKSKNIFFEKSTLNESNINEFLCKGIKKSRLICEDKIRRNTSYIYSNLNSDAKKMSKIILPPEIINIDNFLENEDTDINFDYINNPINKETLYNLYNQTEDNFMKTFLLKHIKLIEENNLDFSNSYFINEIKQYKDESKIILIYYKKNVEKIKFLIDKLIQNILENESIIPYSIKIICKIIDILITKKFNDISIINKNSYISEFFIGKIIIPILTNPDYNGIITSSIISQNTRKNMMYYTKILKKIFRCNLFESSIHEFNYSIFNNYLIEIMPYINNVILQLTNVELKKNFFENNNDNNIIESLAFTYDDFDNLFNVLKDNEIEFLKEIKNDNMISIYKTLKNSEDDIYKLFKNINNIKSKYFIIIKKTNLSLNELMISDKLLNKNFNNNENSLLEKIKLCIKTLLIELKDINLDLYQNLKQSKNSLNFFEELVQYVHMEDYSQRFFENLIPLGWYNIFIQYNLKLLNSDYSENDFEKLYKEIYNECEESIKNINNSSLCFLQMKISSMEKSLILLNKDYLSIKKITKFIKINIFCNNITIPIKLKENQKQLKCEKEKIKNANCIKIIDFIDKYKSLQILKDDISSPNPVSNSNKTLEQYLEILRNEILTNKEVIFLFKEYINTKNSEEEINDILNIIENNILEKVYDNLFTKKPTEKDMNFYNKCVELKNINPTEIGIKKEYINEELWSIAICYINRIFVEKTPYNKLNCISNTYKILNNCINFCEGDNSDAGLDDIFPIFIYIIIKCRPINFISNFYYIKSFINSQKMLNTYGFALMQFEMAINFINNLKIQNI